MKFSVITVTYNSAATLDQCLRSVIAQKGVELEYIVIDGASTDNTIDVVSHHTGGITAFISEKDKGLYDALNKALGMATGDVVAFLHSDDFFIHDEVLAHYQQLFEKTGADAVYADLYYVDRQNTDKIVRKWKSGEYRPSSFYNGWMPPHPTFIAKRRLYTEFGGFDLDFKTAADYELMLRFILKNKIRIAYLPEFVIRMRVGGASNESMKNRIAANMDDRRAWKKNGLKPRFYTLFFKPLRKLLQFI